MTDYTNYAGQGRKEQMSDKWTSDLLFQAPDCDQLIGQRKDSHDFDIVQNEYLKHLIWQVPWMKVVTPINENAIDIYNNRWNGQIKKRTKFLERGMQRVKTKITKATARFYYNTLYECGRNKTKIICRSTWLSCNETG